MAVNEHKRVSLYESARESWGEEDAETLLKSLPHPAADLATKRDVVALRADMESMRADMEGMRGQLRGEIKDLRGELGGQIKDLRGELRGEIKDLRGDMDALRGEVGGEIKDLRGDMLDRFRAQTMWFSGALVAGMSVAASIARFA